MKKELHKALVMLLTLILLLTIIPVSSVSAAGTTYGGLDYSPVYDYNYYISKYDDLKKAFGTNQTKAFNHFIQYGMREGRQASENFNVQVYKANYADLQKAFKDNLPAYYKHYLEFGIKEGRTAGQYVSRYKCIVRIDNKAGELTSNQVSTVSISYARNTTASFSFNGWARVENGISNITYDITHTQTGTKIIVGNQATVLGVKNAQERSFQVECIQLKHLKNGENVINIIATDKNGKREAIGCIKVTVTDKGSSPVTPVPKAQTVTVTFDLNGINTSLGYNSWHQSKQTVGNKYTLPQNPPDENGYKFAGWYTENGQKVDSSTIVSIAKDHKLLAHWDEKDTSSEWKDELKTKYGMEKYMFTNRGFYQCELNEKDCGFYVHTYVVMGEKITSYIVWQLGTACDKNSDNIGVTPQYYIKVLASSGNNYELRANANKPMIEYEVSKYSPDLITRVSYHDQSVQGKSTSANKKKLIVDIFKATVDLAKGNVKDAVKTVGSSITEIESAEVTTSSDDMAFGTKWAQTGDLCKKISVSLKENQSLINVGDRVWYSANVNWPDDNVVPEVFLIRKPETERNVTVRISFAVYGDKGNYVSEKVLEVEREYIINYKMKDGKMVITSTI